jgi:hypothetical protein
MVSPEARYQRSLKGKAASSRYRRFDVREVLTVHTRRALVGAALGIGMSQETI